MDYNMKNTDKWHRLLSLLKTFAYEKREVTLASGQKSNFYINCKQASFMGESHYLIGELFYSLLSQVEKENSFQACGGMALGAAPLLSALSLTCFLNKRELPAIIVRKDIKEHGTKATLEGEKPVAKNSKVLLLEDVITTGTSTIKAANALQKNGFIVDTVLALVDRKAGGQENLAKNGLKLYSLYNLEDFTCVK
ncbi:orotate phosphoribosyltransferase [Sulfobacillus acidophilus]|uniref:Orotate phosphoribosyltransferase n=1 Tax=Sulfobacillus acidophilus TaxID=53633 RepID=A0ABS3AWA6_9FIRM|nr:orotate phosphoribosyltransferase [Sulfobacillus acidophilus]